MAEHNISSLPGELQNHAFNCNGVIVLKNFQAEVNEQRLVIRSRQDQTLSLLECMVEEVEIDGVVYDKPHLAQQALQRIVYTPTPFRVITEQQWEQLQANIQNKTDKTDYNKRVLIFNENISTSQQIDNVELNGRTLVSSGGSNLVVTIDHCELFCATFQKGGVGNITFQAGTGVSLVQVDGTHVLSGQKGSTATVTIVSGEAILRISNA